MEGDVVLLELMDWNAASTAAQFIPLPTTSEVCYELLTRGVCIHDKYQQLRERKRKKGICLECNLPLR